MKESFWAAYIVALGVVAIVFIFLFQNLTNSDEHNMSLLKETTEAAMYDALDYAGYRNDGVVRIDREKFVENFLRRFSENASLARTYKVEFYDVNEVPPKVSIKVYSYETGKLFSGGGKTKEESIEFIVSNRIDAILETPY
ncbi:MAG TPA: DUF5411 family protein [Bacilli bacterium]|nr:DUF5411 family protein [Bacilli bacterium]